MVVNEPRRTHCCDTMGGTLFARKNLNTTVPHPSHCPSCRAFSVSCQLVPPGVCTWSCRISSWPIHRDVLQIVLVNVPSTRFCTWASTASWLLSMLWLRVLSGVHECPGSLVAWPIFGRIPPSPRWPRLQVTSTLEIRQTNSSNETEVNWTDSSDNSPGKKLASRLTFKNNRNRNSSLIRSTHWYRHEYNRFGYPSIIL